MPKRYKSKRKAKPLAARAARGRLNPPLAKDTPSKVVRYAVENGVLWRFYDDGSREQCREGLN